MGKVIEIVISQLKDLLSIKLNGEIEVTYKEDGDVLIVTIENGMTERFRHVDLNISNQIANGYDTRMIFQTVFDSYRNFIQLCIDKAIYR